MTIETIDPITEETINPSLRTLGKALGILRVSSKTKAVLLEEIRPKWLKVVEEREAEAKAAEVKAKNAIKAADKKRRRRAAAEEKKKKEATVDLLMYASQLTTAQQKPTHAQDQSMAEKPPQQMAQLPATQSAQPSANVPTNLHTHQDIFTGTLPSPQNQRTADMKLPAANSTSVNGDRKRLRHSENYVQATFDSSLQHIAQTQICATQILAERRDTERKNELLMVKVSSLEACNHSLTAQNNELKKELHLLKELQSLSGKMQTK